MKLHRWNGISPEQLNPLIARQMIHCDRLTIARIELKKGAVIPRHSHPNEQVTTMVSGTLRFHFDDGEVTVCAGESLQIPGDEPHSLEALEDSVALDVFAPCREDWIRGDDAYLRGR